MSAIDFGNRDGWRRWRAMPDDLRERAEAATVDLLAEMLDEPGRVTFPDWPVVEDDREVEWLACDIALSVARCSGDRSAPMLDRWCAALQRGKAAVAEERAAFLRGGDPPPSPLPPHDASWERDRPRLARLAAPLVLVTERRAVAA